MTIRVGFIGVGGVARPHLETLSRMSGVEISAVCDVDREKAATVGEQYGCPGYANYRTMLKNENLDAVYICVFPAAHKTMELYLAQEGIPFFVEKPVHLNLEICKKTLRAIDQHHVTTAVGYHFRSLKSTQEAKKFLDGKGIGQVHGSWFGGMPGVYWWRQKRLSGGQLVEQTTHIVDLARYLAGEVESVFAAASKGLMTDIKKYSVEDTSVLTMKFRNGAVGCIRSGCIGGPHSREEVALYVEGKDFTVRVDGSGAQIYAEESRKIPCRQKWEQQIGNGDKAFIKALKSGSPAGIFCDYRDAVNTLAVTLAGNESMRTGKPVKVPRI